MARSTATQLAQPIFHEPVFGEDISTADPTGFLTRHGSDSELFREIGDLSKKDVVAIPQSRAADDAQFTLAEAYGGHDPAVTKAITGARASCSTRLAIPARRMQENIRMSCGLPIR